MRCCGFQQVFTVFLKDTWFGFSWSFWLYRCSMWFHFYWFLIYRMRLVFEAVISSSGMTWIVNIFPFFEKVYSFFRRILKHESHGNHATYLFFKTLLKIGFIQFSWSIMQIKLQRQIIVCWIKQAIKILRQETKKKPSHWNEATAFKILKR